MGRYNQIGSGVKMIKEWDIVNVVSSVGEIENTQPTTSRPTGAFSSGIRCAVLIAASSLIPTAYGTPWLTCSSGTTSQTVSVLNQLKLKTGRPVRPPSIPESQQASVARTSQQLANSFRSMLRPADPDEFTDSEYMFS
jgi:hypothetical protein